MVGNRLGPDEAYRFARGEMVVSSTGVRTRLQRPFDFLVVADHAENLSLATMIGEKNPDLLKTDFGREISRLVYAGKYGDAYALWGDGMAKSKEPLAGNDALTRSMWERLTTSAERFNEPGRFTALIGYEWRSSPGGNNLHRNVIFRGNGAQAVLIEPYTTLKPLGSDNPEDLWKWMQAAEEKTGGDLLAIAHNGNLSNALMFPMIEAFGKKIDQKYAQTRIKWERLYEMTQTPIAAASTGSGVSQISREDSTPGPASLNGAAAGKHDLAQDNCELNTQMRKLETQIEALTRRLNEQESVILQLKKDNDAIRSTKTRKDSHPSR